MGTIFGFKKIEQKFEKKLSGGLTEEEWLELKVLADGLLQNGDGGRLVYYRLRNRWPILMLSFQSNSFANYGAGDGKK